MIDGQLNDARHRNAIPSPPTRPSPPRKVLCTHLRSPVNPSVHLKGDSARRDNRTKRMPWHSQGYEPQVDFATHSTTVRRCRGASTLRFSCFTNLRLSCQSTITRSSCRLIFLRAFASPAESLTAHRSSPFGDAAPVRQRHSIAIDLPPRPRVQPAMHLTMSTSLI